MELDEITGGAYALYFKANVPEGCLTGTLHMLFNELGLIEQWGSGVRRIFAEAAKLGLPEPAFSEISTGIRLSIFLREPVHVSEAAGAQSGAQSLGILQQLASGPQSASELVTALGLKSKTGAFKRSIRDLLDAAYIAYTLPGKPDSRMQKYRLTDSGRQLLMSV